MQAHETVTTTELLRITLQQIGRYSGRILSVMGLIWLLQMPSYFSERLLLPLDAMALLGLPPGPVSLAAGTIVMLATYIGTTWSAVGWHRLVLLGEEPARFLPIWHTQPVLAYFIVSLLLPVVTWGPALAMAAAIGMVILKTGAPPILIAIPAFSATVFGVWLSLRLAPVQVSRALRERVGIHGAYLRTAPLSRPLWGCAIIGALCIWILVGIIFAVRSVLIGTDGSYLHETAIFLDAIAFLLAYFLFFIIAVSGFNTVYLLPDTEDDKAEVFS